MSLDHAWWLSSNGSFPAIPFLPLPTSPSFSGMTHLHILGHDNVTFAQNISVLCLSASLHSASVAFNPPRTPSLELGKFFPLPSLTTIPVWIKSLPLCFCAYDLISWFLFFLSNSLFFNCKSNWYSFHMIGVCIYKKNFPPANPHSHLEEYQRVTFHT